VQLSPEAERLRGEQGIRQKLAAIQSNQYCSILGTRQVSLHHCWRPEAHGVLLPPCTSHRRDYGGCPNPERLMECSPCASKCMPVSAQAGLTVVVLPVMLDDQSDTTRPPRAVALTHQWLPMLRPVGLEAASRSRAEFTRNQAQSRSASCVQPVVCTVMPAVTELPGRRGTLHDQRKLCASSSCSYVAGHRR